jgi:hypothetical protein
LAYLLFGARCLLLVVFAVSAAGKLRGAGAFGAFRRATVTLVPWVRPVGAAVAAGVVAAESAVVVLLATPATVSVGFAAGLGLLGVFTVAIAAALRRGSTEPCRCFGASASPLGARHLVRNAILLLAAASGFAAGTMPGAAEPWGLVFVGATAVVLALLVVWFDVLADLFAGPAGPVRPKRSTT